MSGELSRLLEMARRAEMTPDELEKQRRSFAYGNTKTENESITWETIDRAADSIKNS